MALPTKKTSERHIVLTHNNIVGAPSLARTDQDIARAMLPSGQNLWSELYDTLYSGAKHIIGTPHLIFSGEKVKVSNPNHDLNLQKLYYIVFTGSMLVNFFYELISEVRAALKIPTDNSDIDRQIATSQLNYHVSSAYRPNDKNSHHSTGRAIDIWGISASNTKTYNIADYSLFYPDLRLQSQSIMLNGQCPITVAAVIYAFNQFARSGYKLFLEPLSNLIHTRYDIFFPIMEFISPVGNWIRVKQKAGSMSHNSSPMVASYNVHIKQTPEHLGHIHIAGGSPL